MLLHRLESLCVGDDRAVAGVSYVPDRAENGLVALLRVKLDQRVVAVGEGQDLTGLQALGHTVEPEHFVSRVETYVEGGGIGLFDRRELRADARRGGRVLDIVVRGRDDRVGTLLDVLPDQLEGLLGGTASVVDMVDDMGVDVEHRCSSLLFVYCYSPRNMVPGTVSAHVLVAWRHRGMSMMKGSSAFACCLSHPSSMMRGSLCAHPASAARVRRT